MTTFQLDENNNSRKFTKQCNAGGKCKLLRYPSSLMGKDDTVMLPKILKGNNPLLTSDFTIVDEHRSSICTPNPGIIIIRTQNSKIPFTIKIFEENVTRFKSHYSMWYTQDWSCVHIEVCEESVFVTTLTPHPMGHGKTFDFIDRNFETDVSNHIKLIQKLQSSRNSVANSQPKPSKRGAIRRRP